MPITTTVIINSIKVNPRERQLSEGDKFMAGDPFVVWIIASPSGSTAPIVQHGSPFVDCRACNATQT
ncbi:hypothetical protein [Methylibium sp.]|uniref:hypothetical protein n=1 Tax=Methylibium sp. TaxID=2067992 RepID=UPI00333E9027